MTQWFQTNTMFDYTRLIRLSLFAMAYIYSNAQQDIQLQYIHLKYSDKIKDTLKGASHLSGAVTKSDLELKSLCHRMWK